MTKYRIVVCYGETCKRRTVKEEVDLNPVGLVEIAIPLEKGYVAVPIAEVDVRKLIEFLREQGIEVDTDAIVIESYELKEEERPKKRKTLSEILSS